jgi:hypothetical protein
MLHQRHQHRAAPLQQHLGKVLRSADPGQTCEEQLRAVHRWHARAQRDTRAITAIVWGTRPHTVIEQAVASHVSDDTWPDELADALDGFTKVTWTRNLLNTSTARDNSSGHD